MDSTHLDLLTREGALSVTFTPTLEQEHYAELAQIVGQQADVTELRSDIIQAANRWGRAVEID